MNPKLFINLNNNLCNPWVNEKTTPLTSSEKFQQELEWLLEKYPLEPLAMFVSNGLREFQAGQKALKIALGSSY